MSVRIKYTPCRYWFRQRRAHRRRGDPPPLLATLPAPWPVLRLAARMSGRPKLSAIATWLFTRPHAWWVTVPAWRFCLEVLAGVLALSGIAGVVTLAFDIQYREEDRVNRAWSLVADKVGLREALETLVSRGINLNGVDLSGAYLANVVLSGINLIKADLSRADLSGVDLRGANLGGADLRFADISGTKIDDGTTLDLK